MRHFSAFITVLLLGFVTVAFAQTATPPRAPKTLPANIKTALEAALNKVSKEDGKALAKIVGRFSKKYSDFSPEIVADAVALVADALKDKPDIAKVVIPQIVAAAAKATPGLTGPIVAAAINALPADMKKALIAPIAEAVIGAVPDKHQKVDALNAAFQAAGKDPDVTAALDKVAEENHISIIKNGEENATNSQRYFVDDNLEEAYYSGDQGVGAGTNNGSTSGGGGGNGTQPGSSPTPTPEPTATPTPVPTPVTM